MKIRIETSCLATKKLSGVAVYTKLLAEALDQNHNIETEAVYFNFLDRQPKPKLSIKKPLRKNNLIPLRIYAKLQSFNLAPPFDLFLPPVDLTIFPNFATWPTVKSKYRATTVHDLTYLYFPDVVEEKNLAHLRRVVPRSIKQADFIITVSEAVKAEIVKEFSINPDKCVVTNVPPDTSFKIKNDNEIHQKYKLPTEKFIFFIGNLEPRKDLPTLIAAYRDLPVEIKEKYSLVMAGGNGWKTEKSRQAIDDAIKANENVVHVGFIDQNDASAFYQKASLFVMPSIYEGFGIPILEALTCGTPVVASDIPVLREAGGDAVLFAKAGDPSDFAQKIENILTLETLADKLKSKAAEQLNKFSWTNNVEKIINQIEKLDKKS